MKKKVLTKEELKKIKDDDEIRFQQYLNYIKFINNNKTVLELNGMKIDELGRIFKTYEISKKVKNEILTYDLDAMNINDYMECPLLMSTITEDMIRFRKILQSIGIVHEMDNILNFKTYPKELEEYMIVATYRLYDIEKYREKIKADIIADIKKKHNIKNTIIIGSILIGLLLTAFTIFKFIL